MSFKSFGLNLLFPIHCLGCQQEGTWLCSVCFQKLKFNNQQYQQLNTPHLTQIFIAGDYRNPLLAKLIKKFKYNFIQSLGPLLAQFLIIFWRDLNFNFSANFRHPDQQTDSSTVENILPCLIPIPLSKKRERWRGFNQSVILAQGLAKTFQYPLQQELIRKKQGKTQVSLNKQERLQNIRDAFVWTGDSLLGKTILLIDDLTTTGATLNEAARVLKIAGANKVYGLVLAKG